MAIQFPASPTNGQVYQGYYYDSTLSAWKASPVSAGPVAIADVAPTGAIHGDVWYNSTDGTMYIYYVDGSSSQWVESIGVKLDTFVPITATGGATSTITVNSIQYKVHIFTTVGLSSFTVTDPGTNPYIEYLIVGGGGGGGCSHSGGGGAGAMITGITSDIVKGTYEVSVGAGGAGATSSSVYTYTGVRGGTSYIFGIRAAGGGGGGGRYNTDYITPAGGGGSGGGGAGTRMGTQTLTPGGAGSQLYGSDGGWGFSDATAGNGGGGGGAGAAGGNATGTGPGGGSSGAGGNGLQSSITGTNTYYAGGGAGGRWSTGTVGAPGLGGGGAGGAADNAAGGNATPNTGGGGGGSGGGTPSGGAGGSGIVVVRYPLTNPNA